VGLSYPESPPVAACEFNYRDPTQLSLAYQWAGSDIKVAEWLTGEGRQISYSTIGLWRRKFGLRIAQESYRVRNRGEDAPAGDAQEAVRELTEYLKTRTVPKGVKPAASITGRKYAVNLIGSDVHYPFQHEGAFEVFLGIAQAIQPDMLTLNGDTFDFAQLGRFVKNPAHVRGIQRDLDECRENILARATAAAPDAERVLVLGNHEAGRWMNYLWSRCPEIADLRCLDMGVLLGLDEMGWQYAPDGYWLTEAICVDHGDRHSSVLGGGAAMSARKEMLDVGTSGVSGHTHHLGMFTRMDRQGYRMWVEGGCLCDQRKMRDAGVTARKRGLKVEDWALACTIVYYNPKGESFKIEPVPIIDSKGRTYAIVNGEEISVTSK